MKYLEETVFKFLINKENFYIKKYHNNFYNSSRYIAIHDLGEINYCVVFTNEEHEDINIVEAMEYLKTLDKKFTLNVIILSDGEYLSGTKKYINKLIINTKNNNIIFCDKSCEPLKNIILNVSKNYNTKIKVSLKNKKTTLGLILINVVMFLITAYMSKNAFDINGIVLVEFGAKYNYLIYKGEIWRLITCAFLHGGLTHLIVNMYTLYILGPQVEKVFGRKRYLSIYFFSALTSSLLGTLLNEKSVSVGASGAIFGLFGSILVFSIKERKRVKKEYILNLIGIISLNLVIGFSMNNIDNLGHIGGIIGGTIISIFLSYKNKQHNLHNM